MAESVVARGDAASRWLQGILPALLLAGCAGQIDPWEQPDAPPRQDRPGLEELADPQPRWEPLARSGNRSPYMVFGETYHLLPTAEGYAERGIASWYGRKFHGRQTASGEPYDMFELTAAHRTLPLPVYARVTNLENQRSTIVRINDRGPFHADRIIDLSYGAAVKLGFVDGGTARVKVETITPPEGALPRLLAEVEPETVAGAGAQSVQSLDEASGAIWLQAGAFGNPEAAEALRNRLSRLLDEHPADGRNGPGVEVAAGDDALVRVRVGPLSDLREAGRLQALIIFADLGGVPLIVRE